MTMIKRRTVYLKTGNCSFSRYNNDKEKIIIIMIVIIMIIISVPFPCEACSIVLNRCKYKNTKNMHLCFSLSRSILRSDDF